MATGDRDYLLGPGLDVIVACAEYWADVAEEDADGSYHIRGVCGPDEDAGIVDDNAFTNVGAAWTLRLAHKLIQQKNENAKHATPNQDANGHWLTIAEKLVVPWDDERDIPKQMASWDDAMTIKQADCTLLAHPWHYPMDDQTKARMVDYYRNHYPENQIMMGAAIDALVDCQLGRAESAWQVLNEMMPHIRPPYFWFTEAPNNENGCFLTGIGGLLQLIIHGFAGLTIADDGAWSWAPCLPEALNAITLHNIHHQGTQHTVTITRDQAGDVTVSQK